jgi:outer membrane protein assembly factor BamB
MHPRFRVPLSHRRILTSSLPILAALLALLGTLEGCKPKPGITRTIGASTQPFKTLWVRQDLSALSIASHLDEMVYDLSSARDSLVALAAENGADNWRISLSFERSGVRELLTDGNAVFSVTTLGVDAYDAATGEYRWSTRLGDGHVAVIPQLDAGLLRIYYGDVIYEIDPGSGSILSSEPQDDTNWVIDGIDLRSSPTNELIAVDRKSETQLWAKGQPFYINEGQEPQDLGADILIVAREPAGIWNYARGICALNVRTGTYNWCRTETYLSKMAIDRQSQTGYALRDDFVLVTIALRDGSLVGETSFLPSTLPDELLNTSREYSITFANGVVVVVFGDSGQTFGLWLDQ